MRRWLCVSIISLSLLTIAAKWNESIYSDPVKVAQAFLNAIIEGKTKRANSYLIKRLHNNNHWVNATDIDKKKIFTKWTTVEFKPQKHNFGYVIFNTTYGNMAVKFEREDGKWLWANE